MKKIRVALLAQVVAVSVSLNANAQVLNEQYEIAAFPDLSTMQAPVKPAGPKWMHNYSQPTPVTQGT